MLKVGLLLQLTERVTSPLRRVRSGIRGMSRDGERDVARVGRAFDRLRSNALRAASSIRSGMRAALGSALSGLRSMAARGGLAIGRSIGTAMKRGLQLTALVGLAAAGGLLWQLTGGVIQTASEFEQFQVVLENIEGSAAGARRAMAWVRQFAQTTPYELGDVMSAFVRLRAYGINPMDGSLRSLGNAASGMSKSIMDAVEMMADAQTGEFERLKEFGITASVAGNQVRLSYQRNGRDMVRTARKNGTEIRAAIVGILDERFGGMMDRQSRTLAGLWSNLKDQWAAFQLSVARAGVFDMVKGKIQRLLDKVNQLAANGTLQRWAEQISTGLVRAGEAIWNFLATTDWQAAASNVTTLARAIMALARAVKFMGDVGGFAYGAGRDLVGRGPVGERYAEARRIVAARDRARQEAAAAEARRQAGPLRRAPGARFPGLPGRTGSRRNFIQMAPPVRMPSARPAARQPRAQADIRLRIDAPRDFPTRVTSMSSSSRDLGISVARGTVRVG